MTRKGEKVSPRRQPRPTSDRRARKAAALRKRLIDCALKQFEKNGFTRTSIDAITEAADVGKGTFYNYFDSKEALLAAWGRQLLDQAHAEMAKDPAETEPALRRLFRLFTTLVSPVQDRPRLAGPFVMACLFLSPEIPAAVPLASRNSASEEEAHPSNLLELVLPIVRLALDQKALRTDLDPERVAKTLVGVLYQSVMLSATGEDREDAREALRSGLAIALEGLAPAVD